MYSRWNSSSMSCLLGIRRLTQDLKDGSNCQRLNFSAWQRSQTHCKKKPKTHTVEHYHSWIGLPRARTATLLKQCRIIVTEQNKRQPTSKIFTSSSWELYKLFFCNSREIQWLTWDLQYCKSPLPLDTCQNNRHKSCVYLPFFRFKNLFQFLKADETVSQTCTYHCRSESV